jgi:hypothetical protein
MSLLFYGRPKKSPSSSFLTPNLTNGCITQLSSIRYFVSRWPFFHFLFNTFLFISFLFLQLDIEVLKFFDATISNFSLVVRKVLDMISFSSYIQQWRLVVWEIFFFLGSSSLRMASRKVNLGDNNLGTKRLSSGFFIGIPIIQFHSIFKLLQIDF